MLSGASAATYVNAAGTTRYLVIATATGYGPGGAVPPYISDGTATLTGGGQTWTIAVPGGNLIHSNTFQVDLASDAARPPASHLSISVRYADTSGGTSTTVVDAPVLKSGPPGVTAAVDRAVIGPGETATITWDTVMATGVSLPEIGVDVAPSGAFEVEPCPGTTVFAVQAGNWWGTARSTVAVTMLRRPGTASVCGVWTGTVTEAWTDSAAGTWSSRQGFAMRLPQHDQDVAGRWRVTVESGGYAGGGPSPTAFADLRGKVTGRVLSATLDFATSDVKARYRCPVTLMATIADDEQSLTGTYRSTCRVDGGRDITLEGAFSATRGPEAYPSPWVGWF